MTYELGYRIMDGKPPKVKHTTRSERSINRIAEKTQETLQHLQLFDQHPPCALDDLTPDTIRQEELEAEFAADPRAYKAEDPMIELAHKAVEKDIQELAEGAISRGSLEVGPLQSGFEKEILDTFNEAKGEFDPVSKPLHYNAHPSGIECIQVTKHMSFCVGNAIKYLWRADLKGNAIQDLQKAKQYIEFEIEKRKDA